LDVQLITAGLLDFAVEDAKSARAFLGQLDLQHPIQGVRMIELGASQEELQKFVFGVLDAGRDVGVVSEAGLPCVADPGAQLVAAAHKRGIKVVPLVGPSAIMLSLMASGLNGQCFSFEGYLPRESQLRIERIQALEKESREREQTKIFIETPYRNQALFDALLSSLSRDTRLCIASDLTGEGEQVLTRAVSEWRDAALQLPKVPTMFLFLTEGR